MCKNELFSHLDSNFERVSNASIREVDVSDRVECGCWRECESLCRLYWSCSVFSYGIEDRICKMSAIPSLEFVNPKVQKSTAYYNKYLHRGVTVYDKSDDPVRGKFGFCLSF